MSQTISEFELSLQEIAREIELLTSRAKQCLESAHREQAKDLLLRKQLFEQRYKNISDKKIVIEKSLYQIEDQENNKSLVEVMKVANTLQQALKINLSQLVELQQDR